MCTNRCRTENKPSRPESSKLSLEEINKGTGYDTKESTRTTKRVKKTGSTFTEENSAHEDSNSNMEQEEQRWAKKELACWYVPQLETIPQDRPEGVFRLVGGSFNSMYTKEVEDRKISDIHWILETWDAQGGGFSEISVDWRSTQRKHLDSWFHTSQDEYYTSASHNCHEKIAMITKQQGGIAIFARKELRQYILQSVGNFRGLGRWNSWIIQADPSHRTRMVVAYQVGQAWQEVCIQSTNSMCVMYVNHSMDTITICKQGLPYAFFWTF
jgi:hypothetical protein